MTDSTDAGHAFFQGKIVPFSEAKVSVMTHAFNYGTGVFEGIRGYWNPEHEDMYVFRLEEHFQRFLLNAAIMCIEVPHSVEALIDITIRLVRMHRHRVDVYIRPLAYKQDEKIGVSMSGVSDGLTIFTAPFGNYVDIDRGLALCVSSWRRSSDNAIPGRAKITGNYANTALIKNEAELNGYDEAVALNENGYVCEGSAENIFMVRDGSLVTPSREEGILEGITRDSVIVLAREELGIETIERAVARTELYYADEIFLTGTGAQIAPVSTIDRRKVGTGEIGPITAEIQRLYFNAVRGKLPKYRHWVTAVHGDVDATERGPESLGKAAS